MDTNLSRFKLNDERKKINFLVICLIGLWIFILLKDFIITFTLISFIKNMALGSVLVGLYRSIQKYHYTFWSMAFILMFASVYGIFFNAHNITASYILSFLLIIILMRVLFSPIYYPIVSWWEYDFRYRFDLKIAIFHQGETLEGRLTDFRRKACGVCCFHKLNIGDIISFEFNGEFHHHKFEGQVMSRRDYLVGRPIVYGIKLNLNDENLREYEEATSFWQRTKKARTGLRFKK